MRLTPTITPADSRVKVTPHMPITLQMVKVTTTEPMQMSIIILMGRNTVKATITPPTTTTHFESAVRVSFVLFPIEQHILVSFAGARVLASLSLCIKGFVTVLSLVRALPFASWAQRVFYALRQGSMFIVIGVSLSQMEHALHDICGTDSGLQRRSASTARRVVVCTLHRVHVLDM